MVDELTGTVAVDWMRFVVGALLTAGMFNGVQRLRRRDRRPPLVDAVLESRMQYAIAGFILGALALPSVRESFEQVVPTVTTFFVGWFALAAGCGVDLRVVRRRARASAQIGVLQTAVTLALLAVGLYLLKQTYGYGSNGRSYGGPELMMILAICIVGSGQRRIEVAGRHHSNEGSGPSISSFTAIVLAGVAGSWLTPGSFSIDYPFAAGRDLLIGGMADEAIFTIALAVAIGVVANLVCKDTKPEMLFFPLAGILWLGCGIAYSLRLEPLWVGLVAGAWMINATLRRVDMIDTLESGNRHLPLGVLMLAGWLTGTGVSLSFRWDLFLWVIAFLLLLRPLARQLGIRLVETWGGELFRGRAVRGARRVGLGAEAASPDQLEIFQIGDLALVIAIGCTRLMEVEPYTGILAGTLVGYGVARASAGAVGGVVARAFAVSTR